MESKFEICEYCLNNIEKIKIITHKLNCKNKNIEKEIPEFYTKEKKEKIFNNQDNNLYKNKYNKMHINGDFKAVICPKCSDTIDYRYLKDHNALCPNSNCTYCGEYYPNEFLEDHFNFCEKKNINNRENFSNNNFQQNFTTNHNNVQNYNNIRSVNNNFSENFSQNFNNIFSNNFFNNDNENQNINNRGGVQIITINSNDTSFLNPFASDNDFNSLFNQFFNHRNFIRTNRVNMFNSDFFENILNQLYQQDKGMNKDNLNSIAIKKFKKKENTKKGEEEKCNICISEFENEEVVRELPCKHIYHKECIDTWLVQNAVCPTCKKDLK